MIKIRFLGLLIELVWMYCARLKILNYHEDADVSQAEDVDEPEEQKARRQEIEAARYSVIAPLDALPS